MMVNTMKQYCSRGYVDGCERQIAELFLLAYNREFSLDDWKWRFKDNPCRSLCITTLWDDEKLIAHNALTPFYAYKNGERIISANSGTTMARPEYMGVSIQLFNDCKHMYHDIYMIYGFPNKNSFRITTKYLQHHMVGEICFWSKEITDESIRDPSIHEIALFTQRHGCIYKKMIDRVEYIAERSVEYLNWRFIEKPNSGYKCFELIEDNVICGYIVLNTYRKRNQLQGQIVDIVATGSEQYLRLINFASSYFSKCGCTIVKTWAAFHELSDIYRSLGYSYGAHPFPMTLWDDSISIENAYITMADSDVF